MKSLIKILANTNLGVKIRNTINLKPQIYNKNVPKSSSLSDAFAWRTDGSFKTIFKFSDILDLFYDIKNSYVELKFFNKSNQIIKSLRIDNLNLSNQIIIDKDFLDGLEDYGVFYIYHRSDDLKIKSDIISNRCYLGFSYENNLYSFVHGNVLVSYFINEKKTIGEDIIKTSFVKNQFYKVQKYFDLYDKVELFLTNPTSKKIYFSINNNNFVLNEKCTEIIQMPKDENEIIIKSNCTYLRPVIFNYKNDYIDVHHA